MSCAIVTSHIFTAMLQNTCTENILILNLHRSIIIERYILNDYITDIVGIGIFVDAIGVLVVYFRLKFFCFVSRQISYFLSVHRAFSLF